MLDVIFSAADVVVFLRGPGNRFAPFKHMSRKSLSDTTKASLSAFNLSQLFNEIYSISADISGFWCSVFKLALEECKSINRASPQFVKLHTGSVEKESEVPNLRIVSG